MNKDVGDPTVLGFPDFCPIVHVQSPHGKLGDMGALHTLLIEKAKEFKGVGGVMLASAAWCIANAPTIIEEEDV